MSHQRKGSALERMIRRSLKNGIKTLAGQDHRLGPTMGSPKVLHYHGDRKAFLAILQSDAAQLEPRFDQGREAEAFAELVAQTAAHMAAES